jgi:ketosteroid isomerase-like protein
MTEKSMNEIAMQLAKALEIRDYEKFVSFFADDAIFEIPFTIDGGTTLTGVPKIKEHFESVSKNPMSKLIQIDSVTAKTYFSVPNTLTIEYFTEGKVPSTEEQFKIQSSIALIELNDTCIIHYKDFPNTLGIAKKAGVLPQLAAMWAK